MNRVYAAAESTLHELLHRHDLATWLSIALEQVDHHTSLYADCRQPSDDLFEHSKNAPAMRFSWRYVVDYCLHNMDPQSGISRTAPGAQDACAVATVLTIMYGTAGMSDWLHCFPDIYEDVEGHYKVDHFAAGALLLPPQSKKRKDELESQLLRQRGPHSVGRLLPPFEEGSKMRIELDGFLRKHYRVTVSELQEFAGCVADNFDPDSMNSTVLIGTFDGFARRLHEQSGFAKSKARTFLRLILQDASASTPRNFLQRANRKRMGYYGGVRIQSMRLPGRLHSPSWGANPRVWELRDEDVVVLSAYSCIDAVALQLSYLVTAQVDHLGLEPVGRQDLAKLHKSYRVNCFEDEVRKLFSNSGWTVLGPVKKVRVNGQSLHLQCGEIDAIAVSPDRSALLVVEAKCLPLSIDPKMWHTDLTDFQKKFVPRIEKKVQWCRQNRALLGEHFALHGHAAGDLAGTAVRPLFVTLHPHIAATMQSQYRVMSLADVAVSLANSNVGL